MIHVIDMSLLSLANHHPHAFTVWSRCGPRLCMLPPPTFYCDRKPWPSGFMKAGGQPRQPVGGWPRCKWQYCIPCFGSATVWRQGVGAAWRVFRRQALAFHHDRQENHKALPARCRASILHCSRRESGCQRRRKRGTDGWREASTTIQKDKLA